MVIVVHCETLISLRNVVLQMYNAVDVRKSDHSDLLEEVILFFYVDVFQTEYQTTQIVATVCQSTGLSLLVVGTFRFDLCLMLSVSVLILCFECYIKFS